MKIQHHCNELKKFNLGQNIKFKKELERIENLLVTEITGLKTGKFDLKFNFFQLICVTFIIERRQKDDNSLGVKGDFASYPN